jgi:hypothetical protein
MKILIDGASQTFIHGLESAGIEYTTSSDDVHTHIYCGFDKLLNNHYGDNEDWVNLTNKKLSSKLLDDVGLPVLPSFYLETKEQLLNSDFTHVILKPSVNTGGKYKNGNINETVFYKIFKSPQRLVEILEMIDVNIWDTIADGQYIVQQAAVNSDNKTSHIHVNGLVNGNGECVWFTPVESNRKQVKIGNILEFGYSSTELTNRYGVIEQTEKIVSHFKIKNKFLKFQFVILNDVAYCIDISYTYTSWRHPTFHSSEVMGDYMKFIYDLQPNITYVDNNIYVYKQYENIQSNSNIISTAIELAKKNGLKFIPTPQPYALFGTRGTNKDELIEMFNNFENEFNEKI